MTDDPRKELLPLRFRLEKTDAATWAELVLRRYARQAHRLIVGRVFAVRGSGPYADALRSALAQTLTELSEAFAGICQWASRSLWIADGLVFVLVDNTFSASASVSGGV